MDMARVSLWRLPLQMVSLATVLLGVVAGAAAAPPILTRVEPTADGYALVGMGFGTDRSKVQVFEGATPVAPAAIASLTNDRIAVRSKPVGKVAHKVVVGGQASRVVVYNHPVPRAALPSAPAKLAAPKMTRAPAVRSRNMPAVNFAGTRVVRSRDMPAVNFAGTRVVRSRDMPAVNFAGARVVRSRDMPAVNFAGTRSP